MSIPVGQLTWAGVGKQSGGFSTKVAPAIFHGISSFSPTAKISYIDRLESRNTPDRVLAADGPYSFSGTFKAAPDPGAVEQLMAYAMGVQSTPSNAVIYTTASTAAVTTTGSQTVNITAGTGAPNLAVGNALIFDAGGANQETVTLTAVTANSITAAFTKTHPTAATIELLGTLSYGSSMSYSASVTEPPYFTLEHYRGTDCYDFVGCAIDTAKISLDMGAKLADFEFGLVGGASLPIVNGSPATPSFSTLLPYSAILSTCTYTGGAGAQQLGAAGVVPLQSIAISLNNQLDKGYWTIGSQFPKGFPYGQRKVSVTLKTGFESNQEWLDFLAQGTVALALKLTSASVIETINGIAVPYSMTLTLPTMRIMQDPVSQKTSGPLDQTLSLEAYQSTIGSNNSLGVSVVNTATAVY